LPDEADFMAKMHEISTWPGNQLNRRSPF